jgi:hypothetical protein
MFSLAPRKLLTRAAQQSSRRSKSTTNSGPSLLEGDAGGLATRAHHTMTTSLAVATPILFLVPDSYTDGIINKGIELFLTVNIAGHSWVGLNYVVTDYVPKISKALLMPARVANMGIAVVTLVGLSKIALTSPGGIKGAVKGLWNPKSKKDNLSE